MRLFKEEVLRREQAQLIIMAKKWKGVEASLAKQISQLASEASQQSIPSTWRLMQMDRYSSLLAKAQIETAKYDRWAAGNITDEQRALSLLGLQNGQESIRLALSDAGLSGVRFDLLHPDALDALIGGTRSGTPLYNLLRDSYPTAVEGMTTTLLDGVSRGLNPKVIAKLMAESFSGLGLSRAINIARTEQLRVYREANKMQYKASGIIDRYQRLATHDTRVCISCLMDEGTVYPLSEEMPEHPRGRCTLIPVIDGLDPIPYTNGQDWFRTLPESKQRSFLGPSRFKAWKDGDVSLSDFIGRRENSIWGPSAHSPSLSDLGISRVFPTKLASVNKAAVSLDDLQRQWFSLQNDNTLTKWEKADLAKKLRKQIREAGGSVRNFTEGALSPVLSKPAVVLDPLITEAKTKAGSFTKAVEKLYSGESAKRRMPRIAMSPEQMERWSLTEAKSYPQLKDKFSELGISLRIQGEMEPLKDEVVQIAIRDLETGIKQYRGLLPQDMKTVILDFERYKNKGAVATYFADQGKMILRLGNKTYWKEAGVKAERMVSAGWWSSPNATAHELGHGFHWDELGHNHLLWNSLQRQKSSIGTGYGKTDRLEFIAECMAGVVNGTYEIPNLNFFTQCEGPRFIQLFITP